jgi:hypothetical protein
MNDKLQQDSNVASTSAWPNNLKPFDETDKFLDEKL